ncbi:hypothetical protein D3C80_1529660 [compost metagenome]
MAGVHIFRDSPNSHRILYAPEKCFHGRQGDFHHFTGDKPVRFAMHALRGCGVRGIHKAKGRATPFIKPVGQKLDAILILNIEVFKVRRSNIRSGNAGKLVPVHEDRHWFLPRVFRCLLFQPVYDVNEWSSIVLTGDTGKDGNTGKGDIRSR